MTSMTHLPSWLLILLRAASCAPLLIAASPLELRLERHPLGRRLNLARRFTPARKGATILFADPFSADEFITGVVQRAPGTQGLDSGQAEVEVLGAREHAWMLVPAPLIVGEVVWQSALA